MRRITLAVFSVFAVGLLACGEEDAKRGGTGQTDRNDAEAITRVANKYVNALAAGDGRAACQTRSRAERRGLARLSGSCAKSFEAIEQAGKPGAAGVVFRQARARAAAIEIRGNRARVPIFRPGQERPTVVLKAQREKGRWLLISESGDPSAPRIADSGRPPQQDAAALVRLVDKYLAAFAAKDWRAACQTRSRAERRALARLAGSCVRAFEAIDRSGKADAASSVLRGVSPKAAKIEVRRNRALVPVFQPGQDAPASILVAKREDGVWRLVDVPDAKQAAFLRDG